MRKLFCKDSSWLKTVNYFRRKAPSLMFYPTTIHLLTKTNNQTLLAKDFKITNFTKTKHNPLHPLPFSPFLRKYR